MNSDVSVRERLLLGEPVHFLEEETEGDRTVLSSWLEVAARKPVRIDLANAIIRGPLSLKYVEFPEEFSLVHCDVKDPADFSYTTFRRNLVLTGTVIRHGADFQSATLIGDCFLIGVNFLAGQAAFMDVHIVGILLADGMYFAEGVKADFNRARIDKFAFFRRVIFKGEADFGAFKVGGNASFAGAQFIAEGKTTSFSAANFEGDASFEGALFATGVLFIGVQIAGQARFPGAQFKLGVGFNGARIERAAFFRGRPEKGIPPASFEGETDFIGVLFGSDADFDGAVFQGRLWFSRAQIGGSALFRKARFLKGSKPFFRGTRFRQRATFQEARFEDLADFRATQFSAEALFHGAIFAGKAEFDACTFAGLADFSRTSEEGRDLPGSIFGELTLDHAGFQADARFEDSAFLGKTSFRETSFRVVYFSANGRVKVCEEEREQFQGTLDLRGCKYDRIRVSWPSFLSHLEPYDRQPYVQLEKAHRQAGQDEQADQVYLERRRVERAMKKRLAWFLDWIYWRGANYGVRPLRLLLFAVLLVGWGVFIFRFPGAVRDKTPAASNAAGSTPAAQRAAGCPKQLRFWEATRLSAREFMPVDLPLLKDCEASDERRFRLRFSDWAALLKITGWIIVPVGIAALTGLLRRVAP